MRERQRRSSYRKRSTERSVNKKDYHHTHQDHYHNDRDRSQHRQRSRQHLKRNRHDEGGYYKHIRRSQRSREKDDRGKKYRDFKQRERTRKKYSSYSQSSCSESYSSQGSSQSSSSSSYQSSEESVSIITSGSTQQRRRAPHYRFQRGQKLGHKYWIRDLLGDGTFGRVLKAQYEHKYYAIKLIKPVQKYIKSAKIQRNILRQINQKDPNNSHGIVKVIESFYHRNHFCIVFQQLGSSLYDLIKKNRYKGFPRTLVKKFFYQILRSLEFIHSQGYTHTDLKPQNILLEKDDFEIRWNYRGTDKYYYPLQTRLKIIDFGSATKYNQHHSSIINTRQYRSPEVLLECCQWDQISDVWSIGCIIVQLYTGNLLFDTHEDHEHLAMIAKNSGIIPQWMVKQCTNDLREILRSTGQIKQHRLQKYVGEGENIIFMKTVDEIFENDQKLRNLLMKCLEVDPTKRISCKQALKDPYFKDYQL